MPPLNADERTTLESWLEFHRATMAEVERNWFRRVLAAEPAPPIDDPTATRMVLTAASTWPRAPP